jgi:hypothetical protein
MNFATAVGLLIGQWVPIFGKSAAVEMKTRCYRARYTSSARPRVNRIVARGDGRKKRRFGVMWHQLLAPAEVRCIFALPQTGLAPAVQSQTRLSTTRLAAANESGIGRNRSSLWTTAQYDAGSRQCSPWAPSGDAKRMHVQMVARQ